MIKRVAYLVSFPLLLLLSGCADTHRDIPFFKQTDSGNCLQTNLKIALAYYYPERDYSFDMLDNATGRTQGKWTWTSQAIQFLVAEGLDAYYYSTTPYTDILEKGEDIMISYYGDQDGRIMIEHTDFAALYSSIRSLNSSGRYFDEKLDFDIIEQEFKKGSMIMMLIDSNALIGREPYSGHFVTITGIAKDNVIFHDTSGTPNRVVSKEDFLRAWNANGTDNDVIIIKGKL